MRFILMIIILIILAPVPAMAQGAGPGSPIAGLNLIFFVENKWAMYGAPQDHHLTRGEFEALLNRIRETRFPSVVTQVVVMLRDSEVEGTLGLIEKRGLRAAGIYVGENGVGPYDIWHTVGYQINPDKLLTDFHENVLAAEATYRDLPVVFEGQVKRVGKDNAGQVFVEFEVKQPGGLICYPWPEAPQVVGLSSLRGGDRLKVTGQFTEMSDNTARLRGCLFSR